MGVEVGDIYTLEGRNFKVIGVNLQALGGPQYWVRNMYTGAATTYGPGFLGSAEKATQEESASKPKFKVGDKRLERFGGSVQEIKAVEVTDDQVYYWIKDAAPGRCMYTGTEEFFERLEEIPRPFFEKDKEYRSKTGGKVLTIWHVLDMENEAVAVGQASDGKPVFLREEHFKSFEEI